MNEIDRRDKFPLHDHIESYLYNGVKYFENFFIIK